MSDQVPANVLEENSRQMDQHKKRLVFRTLTGNSEVWVEVHALQSGGDDAPGRRRCACCNSCCFVVLWRCFLCTMKLQWASSRCCSLPRSWESCTISSSDARRWQLHWMVRWFWSLSIVSSWWLGCSLWLSELMGMQIAVQDSEPVFTSPGFV